ncbi:MAG: RHS repeat-associated core domain-containing protein [Ferruginibacter sp.]
MLMPGRKYNAGNEYRYGFNGKENDKDIDDGDQDYGMRIYDSRLGRFLSLDPMTAKFPFYTPYQFTGNKPIWCNDLDGCEDTIATKKGFDFSAAKNLLPRKPYKDYGNFLSNLVGNTIIENNVGNNISGAIVNQTVQGAEDLTNLSLSAEGTKKVLNSYANTIYKAIAYGVQTREDPVGALNRAKAFLSDPEKLENLAASGFLFLAMKVLPSFRIPGLSFSNEVLEGRLPIAEVSGDIPVSAKIGWKVGEPITNFTAEGKIPSWSTVRQRFWKNEGFLNGDQYIESNLLRIKKGLAPRRLNPITGLGESMELHHYPLPQRDGGLFEFMKVWPEEHKLLDPYRY